MDYYVCGGCFHKIDESAKKCNNCGLENGEKLPWTETVYKKTELRCHVCDRVFHGSALINCDNENCPGVIFPTEIED
jgi:hypothetical protein